MRRLALALLALVAIGGLGFAWVDHAQPGWWVRLRYPLYYRDSIVGYGHQYHLDPALIAAVVYEESRFKANARSSAGAIGLMQLTPDTARGIALNTNGSKFRLSDLTNPDINVRYGTWYLRRLLDKYHDEPLALAAYNAGQTNVDGWLAQHEGIHFAETRAYVDKVESLKKLYRRVYAGELGY